MKGEKRVINEEWREGRFLERWWKSHTVKGKAEIYKTITGKSVEKSIQEKFMGE